MSLIREVEVTNIVSVDSVNNGLLDTVNSSATPLGISGVFDGDWQDTINFNVIIIGVAADQDSATDGLEIQWSSDGVTKTQDDVFSIFANAGKVFTFSPANRYFKIVYTNGVLAQTAFNIQAIFKKAGFKPSSHRLRDDVVSDDDAELVKAVISGLNLAGNFENVGAFRGGLNVHQSDVHRFSVNTHFIADLANTTTVTPASSSGETEIDVADTTGFIVGSSITITDGSTQEPDGAVVTVVAAGTPGTLTLDRPLDFPYQIGSIVSLVEEDFASVAGTLATPVSYKVSPPAGEIWHILRILVSSKFGTAADDSRLGNISGGVTNGLVLRQSLTIGHRTITNWKTNADLKLDMFDLPYTDRAGGGGGGSQFGMNGRWTFKNTDFVPELVGDDGDYLEILVQDDITSLVSFEIHAQGHKVGQ